MHLEPKFNSALDQHVTFLIPKISDSYDVTMTTKSDSTWDPNGEVVFPIRQSHLEHSSSGLANIWQGLTLPWINVYMRLLYIFISIYNPQKIGLRIFYDVTIANKCNSTWDPNDDVILHIGQSHLVVCPIWYAFWRLRPAKERLTLVLVARVDDKWRENEMPGYCRLL